MKPWNSVPEIEPLPDTTWRRIERSVFADLDRNPEPARAEPPPHWLARWRRPLLGLGLGVGLAAAAALLLVLRGNPGSVPQPSRIVTHDAPVALTVGRADVLVAPASTLWVQSNHGHEVMMILEQGRVECTVAHDKNRPPLVLQAGDVRVEVVGTSFAVTRQDDSVTVEVDEGVVEVFHQGRLARVGAGQRWTPAGPGPAVGTRAAATETGSAQRPADPAPAGSQAQAEPGAMDGAVAGTVDGAVAGARTGPADAARRAIPRRETAGAEPPEPAVDPKQRYEQAAGLEAAEPAAAIAIYRELARGKSAWAANALFAQARLELDRGRTAEAVRLLETYLRRYPGGNNAADARALLEATGRPTSGR
jgi:FecR protein